MSHYFSAQPSAAHRQGQVRVVLPDLYLELSTDSGVFSPGRLDPGTRLLLEEAPRPPAAGDLLDLGCGYGPIACALAARAPGATVWAVDVNERALALCAANAARAGLPNVRSVTPAAPEIPPRLAGIWSNPPVRIGKGPLRAMLRTWLARLAPGAAATLVMGRNLGADSLHAWLEKEEGWPVTRLAARSGYRLLQVTARLSSGRTPGRQAAIIPNEFWSLPMADDTGSEPGVPRVAGGTPRQLRPTDVKRLNREWRRRTEGRLALLLDSVSQPFNVGSIVRTAAAFGVESVWLCGNTPDLSVPAVGKTALGTHRFLASHHEPSPAAAAKAAAEDGFRVVAVELASGAVPLFDAPLDGAVCLAIGNEDHGCSPALLAAVSSVAYIPQVGRVGSLNVAVAAAIALAEARRREWTTPAG